MDKKKFSVIVALACSLGVFNSFGTYATSSSDDTLSIDAMEDLKKANQQQIDELQSQIDDTKAQLEQSKDDEELQKEYQKILDNKIVLQQENVTYVENQLVAINEEIDQLNDEITDLENNISDLEVNIDTNMEQFKKRLKAMYISGNDSLASVLMGSTDFLDILCKMEFISRISSHDNALMETLKSQINEYDDSKEELSSKLDELEESKATSSQMRDEFTQKLEELSNDYMESQGELDEIALQQEALNASIDDLEQYQKEQEEEEEKIQQAIEEYYIQSSIEESQSISESVSVSKSESVSASQSVSASVSASISESVSQSIAQSVAESLNISIEQAKLTTTTPKVVNTQPVTVATTTEATTNSYYTSGFFNWPTPNNHVISDYYGLRTWNNQGIHYGLDISGNQRSGDDIVSAESGTVILVSNYCTHNYAKSSSCGCGGGFGNYVIVDHGNGYATLYGHCSSIDVSVGQKVQRGEVIAHIGSTGYSTGYHLHFEVRINGDRVDPLPYLS